MKKLTWLLLISILIGCETPSIDFQIEAPEIPIPSDEELEESLEETIEYPEFDLVFETKDSPFNEIVDLDPQCYDENYLEEKADFIVQALVRETGDTYVLKVLDWYKGDPSMLSEKITFTNTISTSPSFAPNMQYEIYFSKVGDVFVTTCYQEGVKLNHSYGDDALE